MEENTNNPKAEDTEAVQDTESTETPSPDKGANETASADADTAYGNRPRIGDGGSRPAPLFGVVYPAGSQNRRAQPAQRAHRRGD